MRIKTILVAVMLALAPTFAFAGIFADLGSMVMSNTTAPGVMTTKDRVGVFMGGFTMRAPIQAVNLITFDPPRIDAGCGGIDLYGGSFSFINGQQLIQIFRQVAADAAGLAFKAAIKAISPSLDALITEFQTLLQNLNNPFLKQQSANNPKSGNNLVKTVVSSGASSIMGLAGLPNVDGSSDDATNPNSLNNEILYALLGYHIDAVPCNDLDQNGQGVSSSTPSGNSIGQVTCSGPALLTLDDIVKGGGTGSLRPDTPLSLYKCANPSGSVFGGIDDQICTQMQVFQFNYQGIDGWVNTMLFGQPDPADGVSSSSIVGQTNSGQSTNFTTAQIQFMQQTGVPLAALLAKTSNPNTRIAIAQRLAPHIVDCVAAHMGEVLYKGANLIQTSTGFDLNQDEKDHIKQLRSDYMAKESACNNSDVLLKIVTEINEDTRFMATNSR
jgi:conjugative transfer pilus assembly protein TraH